MRRVVIVTIATAVACMIVGAGAQTRPPQTPPTFTANTDVVMVDVTVRKGGAQLTGLTAADFELRDNGVLQDVETVESQAVPIDLSVVVDVSGNPDRPWGNLPLMSQVAREVDEQARKLTHLLRPGDRVRLFAFDTYVQQLWALQPADQTPAITRVDYDGQASLYDTLLMLLLQPVEPKRRHVIVAATKGLDTISVIAAADVRQVADQSDAQLHLVMLEKKADEEVTVRPFQCKYMDLCSATYRFWVPARRRLFAPVGISQGVAPLHLLLPDGQALKAGAESTGGGLYQGEGLSEPTLFGTFEKAFENFRQSYILRYSAKGVARPGWHQITVTVPRDKSVRIKARNGYSIDVPSAPPVAAPPPPAANAALKTVSDLTRVYELAAHEPVTRSLRQVTDPVGLIKDFEDGGNPWPRAPRREAALALEIAETGVFSPTAPAREAGQKLLDRFSRLVRRPLEPDAFERAWLVSAVAILQGTIRPAAAGPFVDRALVRFPDEPRFLLARAIITDQAWPFTGTVGTGAPPARPALAMAGTGARSARPELTEALAREITAQYQAAMALPETAAEANIRLAWFLHRTGRSAEALAQLNAARVGPADPWFGYLQQLFMGHALLKLGRPDEAIAAYRSATVLVPGAQSARVSLMNALLARGDRALAEQVAEQVQTAPPTVIDPWWMYWQGDYRRYPQALAAVREMIR